MIQEAFINFDTAKLLKEKGFNEPCHAWTRGGEIFYCEAPLTDADLDPENGEYLCPTHQMVLAWLRENHSLHITAQLWWKYNEIGYYYEIYTVNRKEPMVETAHSSFADAKWKSYEKAVEASIKYCLENLI